MIKKLSIIGLVLLIGLSNLSGSQAQEPDGTLLQLIADHPNFGMLLTTIQSSDASIRETLGSSEQVYTFFAPLDAAFTAMGDSELADLVSDAALLETTLRYHLVPGRYTAAELIAMDGLSLETVAGYALAITVEPEALYINNIPVIVPDIEATNGVIHGIEGLLIPPVEPTATEPDASTGIDFRADQAYLRVLYLNPGSDAIDVYVGDQRLLAGLTYENNNGISAWAALPPDRYDLRVTLANTDFDSPLLMLDDTSLTLTGDQRYSLVLLGSQTGLQGVLLNSDFSPSGAGQARLTMVNLSPDLPSLDLATADAVIAQDVSSIPDPASTTYPLAPGNYTFSILAEDGSYLINPFDVQLTAGRHYLFVVAGTQDAPEFYIVASDLRTADVPAGSPLEPGAGSTLGERITTLESLSTLNSLVGLADPIVAQRLNDEAAGYTLFAPNNAAFALLSDDFLTTIMNDPDQVNALLNYHLVEGRYTIGDLLGAVATDPNGVLALQTVAGDPLYVTVDADGRIFVDNIELIDLSLEASNGLVHVISAVLLPDEE